MVWFAGTGIAGYADAIAEKTGIGREVIGIVLLGGVTSLPEMAVASTASLAGHPALSVKKAQPARGSLRKLVGKTTAAGVLVLAAGFVLAKTGEAIAAQSGLAPASSAPCCWPAPRRCRR